MNNSVIVRVLVLFNNFFFDYLLKNVFVFEISQMKSGCFTLLQV